MIIRERHVLVGTDDAPARLMVLWVGATQVALLDLLDAASRPQLMASTAVEAAIVAETWTVDVNPIEVSRAVGRVLSKKEIEVRDELWKLIEPLVTNVPAIFDPVQRGRLISVRVVETKRSRNTIKDKLDRYWRGGMRIAALIPDFAARGPRGSLPALPGGKKRGRPAGPNGEPHVDVTIAIQKAFQRAVDAERKVAKNRFTPQGAYKRFTDIECMMAEEDPDTGEITYVPKPEYRNLPAPSYRQFKWWFDGTNQKERVGRRQKGDALWDKDHRATLDTSAAQTWGPGSRFQIDATILEVALLSRHRAGDIIGKPVLYVVIDVWSRYIVGFYLGLTNASWAGAAMALANCLESKDELLRRHGYDPSKFAWESRHLPCAASRIS